MYPEPHEERDSRWGATQGKRSTESNHVFLCLFMRVQLTQNNRALLTSFACLNVDVVVIVVVSWPFFLQDDKPFVC